MRAHIVLTLALLLPTSVYAGKSDRRLDMYWIDVEGGAATLIVTPEGESILIDSGNPGFRDPNRIAQTATNVAKLRRIDHLITTHYHRDHFGGAATLSTLLPIGVVHDNGVFEGMPEQPDKEYREFKCEKRVQINPGDEIPLQKSTNENAPIIKLRCLGTRQQFLTATTDNSSICADHRDKDRDGSDNANSVVMLLDFGPFRFFDAGDLTWNQEFKVVCPGNLAGQVDVYQVTHHGLDQSNNPVVMRSLEPTVAIMNNGSTKGCMPEVFANLKEIKSLQAMYQMHKNLRPDGSVNNVPDEYIANQSEEKCEGNIIQLSVDPEGTTYTVSVPSTKHERTFKTREK